MSRVLIVLALLVVGVLVLAFYLRWFHVASDSAAGTSTVTVTVDTDQIQSDKERSLEAARDLGHRLTGKTAAPAAPPPQN